MGFRRQHLGLSNSLATPPSVQIVHDGIVFLLQIVELGVSHDELTAVKVCFQDTNMPGAHGGE